VKVLHVVATGQRRGAEVFAADLSRALPQDEVEQRVAVLRPGERLEVAFEPPVAGLGGNGWSVPGLNLNTAVLRRLSSLVRSWRPDVIQAHGGEALKYSLASARGRAPVVYRRIGEAPAWISQGPRRSVYGWLMRRAARVVSVADTVRRETIRLFGVDPARSVTIPNGVDASRISPGSSREDVRGALGIASEVPVLLSLGALIWEKDPMEHVEVSREVLRRCSGAVHLMAGDGPLRGQAEAAAARSGVNGGIRFLGGRSDVGDLLAACDVVLFGSRPGGMEGMPAVVIEAGMAGLPVAGYAVAGVAEVVADGETGLLAAHGDREALVSHVLRLFGDADERERMGRAARHRCMAEFDIGAIAPRYLDLYRELAP
jgi:glycosyltransferase involved in cell wall biosynthesis